MDLLAAIPATSFTTALNSSENFLRHKNKAAVLDRLRQSTAGISRAELAETLSLSRSTISAIIDDAVCQ
jgi:hypothetical protein